MDLELHIGNVLHLEIPPGGTRTTVRLIGLVPGNSLLVTAPEVAGQPLALAEGAQVSARVFAGEDVLAFNSTVQRVCYLPYPYVHLGYPDAMEATPMRHARRARVHLSGTAESDAAPGREQPVTVHDISNLGAMVWCNVPLGAVGDSVALRLPLEPDPLGAHFAEVLCEIRNVHEDQQSAHRRWGYGVEFSTMSSETALALRTLVMRELARQR